MIFWNVKRSKRQKEHAKATQKRQHHLGIELINSKALHSLTDRPQSFTRQGIFFFMSLVLSPVDILFSSNFVSSIQRMVSTWLLAYWSWFFLCFGERKGEKEFWHGGLGLVVCALLSGRSTSLSQVLSQFLSCHPWMFSTFNFKYWTGATDRILFQPRPGSISTIHLRFQLSLLKMFMSFLSIHSHILAIRETFEHLKYTLLMPCSTATINWPEEAEDVSHYLTVKFYNLNCHNIYVC